MSPRGYFTLEQAAKQTGLSVRTLRRYVTIGRLRAERVGRTYLIAGADLRRLKRPKMGRPRKETK